MTRLGLIFLLSSPLGLRPYTKATLTLPPPKLIRREQIENRGGQGVSCGASASEWWSWGWNQQLLLPTRYLPAARLRGWLSREVGEACRLASSHTEAGVGPEISLEGQRGAVPDPHHQA